MINGIKKMNLIKDFHLIPELIDRVQASVCGAGQHITSPLWPHCHSSSLVINSLLDYEIEGILE